MKKFSMTTDSSEKASEVLAAIVALGAKHYGLSYDSKYTVWCVVPRPRAEEFAPLFV